jgi:molybdopterin molybdotransferase
VRPGKPTWFGTLGDVHVLGLPGNPASAIVCAMLFLRPLIAATSGESDIAPGFVHARLSSALRANGPRETYLRGAVTADAEGSLSAGAFSTQDSSLYTPLAKGNCLIRRIAGAPRVECGDIVECLVYGAPFGRSLV